MDAVKDEGISDDDEEEEEGDDDSDDDGNGEEGDEAEANKTELKDSSEHLDDAAQSLDRPLPRPLSRSPPQSRSSSPSLEKMVSGLNLDGIKGIVSSDLTKARARQQRKYHSKRGARSAGRPQGSKAKQDTRVKITQSGVWD